MPNPAFTGLVEKRLKIQQEMTKQPLLVSSDITKSLFGNYKHIIERSPQADMNRSVLLISALCGGRDDAMIRRVLNEASRADLDKWDKDSTPYTVRRERQKFLNNKNPKIGKYN